MKLPWPLIATTLLACAGDEGVGRDASDAARDAEDAVTADASEDMSDEDSAGEDGPDDARHDAPDDAPEEVDSGDDLRPGLTELTLGDGSRVRGELVATYDQSLWWDAAEAETYALFDAAGFAPYPDDRSLRFVSSLDVSARVTAAGPLEDPPYRDWLRARGIAIEGPPLAGISWVITGNERYHLEENGFGDFAWDLVRTDDDGLRFTGAGAANADFLVWGEPVFLPMGGLVVEVVRDAPDNTPGTYPNDAPENLVGVALGGHYYWYVLHFRQGTIPSPDDASCAPAVPEVPCVVVGAVLPAGAYLGEAGNSGTSLEPHVHMTVLWFDVTADPPRTWSVPSELADVWLSGAAVGPAAHSDYAVPQSGDWIAGEAF